MSASSTFPWLGCYIPDVPTPFDNSDRIDVGALAKLCERQIAAGAPAIVVCGTAGEAATLRPIEQEVIIRTAVDVARRRVRVIAGTCSNSTELSVKLGQRAGAAGADAILSIVPYYNKPTQEGIEAHFTAIAASTTIPIVLYDAPLRSARGLDDQTLVRLCLSGRFAGLVDETGDVTRPLRLRSLLPSGFRFLTGLDSTALAYSAAGGDGCVSLISNITPYLCKELHSNLGGGSSLSSQEMKSRLVRLEQCLALQNPSALKYALSLLGLMSAKVRLPMIELDEVTKVDVELALNALA